MRVEHILGDHRSHYRVEDLLAHLSLVLVLGMVSGDEDLFHGHGAVTLVSDHHLGLAIGAEILQLARLAHLGETLGHPVSQLNGQGHQLRGLIDRKSEHEPLVTGAELAIYTVGDVRALLLDTVLDLQLAGGKARVEAVVADPHDGVIDDGSDIWLGSLADLPADNGQPGGDEDLARHSRHLVVGKGSVENRVRDGVGHLVRVAFCDRF